MKSMILILQQFIKDNSSYLETTEQMIFKVTPRKKILNQHRKKKKQGSLSLSYKSSIQIY